MTTTPSRTLGDLHPPARRRDGLAQRGGDVGQRHPGLERDGRGRERVADVVRADQAQRDRHALAAGVQRERRRGRVRRGRRPRPARPASGASPASTTRACVRAAIAAHQRVVGVEHRQAVGGRAPRRVRPWPGRSPPGCRTRRGAREPTLSTTPIRGGAIAARWRMCPMPARAHLQHEEARRLVGAQHRVREAEFVVHRPGRGDRRAEPCEQVREQVLRRRLARRAGDPDDGQRGQPPRDRRGERRQGGDAVARPRCAGRRRGGSRAPPPRPRSTAVATKSCPSTRSPGSARNSPPGRDQPRVVLDRPGDRRSRDRRRRRRPPTIVAISARLSAIIVLRPSSARRAGRRGRRTGGPRRRPPDPARVPCPRSAPYRRARARSTAAAIAAARSPISITSPRSPAGTASAPASIARRIVGRVLRARVVVGDDQQVGAARRDLAHERPLGAVAVAAAAEHDRSAGPRVSGRSARSAPSTAAGLWL